MAAFRFATSAGAVPNVTFKSIAEKMFIPFDSKLNYHPEFTGFNRSWKIKQADTVLMYYPLGVEVDQAVERNDLLMYSHAQDIDGVAMTWGIHAILWRDVGDEVRAAKAFTDSYETFARPPFFTWHEGNATDGSGAQGAPNLVTGAGGFLQGVWAGYGGVRFTDEGVLTLKSPRPLPNSTLLRLRRLSFLGARLDITATMTYWSVSLSDDSAASAPALDVVCEASGRVTSLSKKPLHMPSGSTATVRRHGHQVIV